VKALKQFLRHVSVGIQKNQRLSLRYRRPAVPYPRDIMFSFPNHARSERAGHLRSRIRAIVIHHDHFGIHPLP
jgi:hypothetical protein